MICKISDLEDFFVFNHLPSYFSLSSEFSFLHGNSKKPMLCTVGGLIIDVIKEQLRERMSLMIIYDDYMICIMYITLYLLHFPEN